jgi:hypothetical protein
MVLKDTQGNLLNIELFESLPVATLNQWAIG